MAHPAFDAGAAKLKVDSKQTRDSRMRQGKKNFRHESLQDRASVQAILKAITQGIAKGRLTLSDDDDEMVLSPDGLLQLKLTATQDSDRHRINLRISWQAEEGKSRQGGALKVKVK
jgi:amphi-Trp domain-containing protein